MAEATSKEDRKFIDEKETDSFLVKEIIGERFEKPIPRRREAPSLAANAVAFFLILLCLVVLYLIYLFFIKA